MDMLIVSSNINNTVYICLFIYLFFNINILYTVLLQCTTIYATGNNQIPCDKAFTVGGGTVLHIYNCYPYCTGDTRLYLYDGNNNQIAYNDDSCGSCSSITHMIPINVAMQTYTVKMDCYSSSSTCTGNIQIDISTSIYISYFYQY
jgi:hypothetical protein